jgi:RNA polymerase sigma factor (sigma-70 family)
MPGFPWRLLGIAARRVPPNWSARDWRDEMCAVGVATACQAQRDYDPRRGVPYPSFVRLRVLASMRTRYRQEQTYAARCQERGGDDGIARAVGAEARTASSQELRDILDLLSAPDRRLIEQLFWEGLTESDVARQEGVSQQAVSKQKRVVLHKLRGLIGGSEEDSTPADVKNSGCKKHGSRHSRS